MVEVIFKHDGPFKLRTVNPASKKITYGVFSAKGICIALNDNEATMKMVCDALNNAWEIKNNLKILGEYAHDILSRASSDVAIIDPLHEEFLKQVDWK